MLSAHGWLKRISLCLLMVVSVPLSFAQGECNRIPTWDWTIDQTYNLYTATQGTFANIRLPYFDYGQPASELNKGALTDIYPEDGWVLVFRDFGLPTCPTNMPLFLLYNKFSGTLRLFYFNTVTNSTFTHGLAYLSQPNASKASPFFNHGRSNYFVNNFDTSAVESTIHTVAPMQWCYTDFTITGYDNTLATDATLRIEIRGINVNDIHLDGSINLEQVVSGEGNLGSKLNLSSVTTAVTKGFKWYKDVDKGKTELTKLKNANPTAWYSNALGTILNSGIAGVASPLAGVAGLVSSFISGSHSGQTMPMKFEGQINLNGTMTNSGHIYMFEIRAPGAPLSNPSDSKRPDYTQPLGIYNIVDGIDFDYKLSVYCSLVAQGQTGETDGFFSDQELWDDYYPEMLALSQDDLSEDEIREVIAFILEDRSLQRNGPNGGSDFGGGIGPGGTTCQDVFLFKLTRFNIIVNPSLAGKVTYTLGAVKSHGTTYYRSQSSWMAAGGKVVTISDGVTTKVAVKVAVKTDVAGDPPVVIVNSYDCNLYHNYSL